MKTENGSKDLPPVKPGERSGNRRRALLPGRIVYGDGAMSAPCTIRDLSDMGARVTLDAQQPVPQLLYLVDVKNQSAFEAKVAWRRTPNFGLHFLRKFDINALPPELAYLRKIWVECADR